MTEQLVIAGERVPAEGKQRSPIRAVIIDDHDVVHAGVQAWCTEADPPIRFVGNYFEPTEFFEQSSAASPDADVIIFDLQIDGNKPAFDTLQELCTAGHRVVVYSHITAAEVVLHCLELGAITYLVKSEGRAHLIEAIQAASSNTPYMGPRMAQALLNDSAAGRPNLSEREKEVLVAWFQTESKDLVGKRLFIAPSTVRTHLQRARAKYAAIGRPAPTKSALLARAVEDGILSLSDLI